ncbi:MAG: type secretion protein [Hyphomicrobiales bacterium]|nr:type secretion protein [Hyphomicrobiales bacterium]
MRGVAVFSGVVNLLTLSGSVYMLQVYDRVIPSRNISTLLGLSLMVVIAYVLHGYFDAKRTRMMARIGAMFDAALQEPIHMALATLPLRGTRPILAHQPLRDLDSVRAFMSGIGPTAFLDMPWTPLFVIVLFLFHPLIGVAATVGAGLIVGMTFLTESRSRDTARGAMVSSAQRQVLADSTRCNAEVIRALGMTGRLTARWAEANERFLQENLRTMDLYANLGAVAKVLRFILQSGILGIGAYLVVTEQASGGIMIASSIVMGRALAPIEIALGSWKQMTAARQSLKRLKEILKATAAPEEPVVILPRPEEELSVQGLTVIAPGTDRVLVSQISFSLAAGTGLALLGASGSGKSSLIKALVGVWPAVSGSVRLDGATIDQWASDDFGRHTGYLPQDVALLDGTIAENIARFSTASATSPAVLEAATIAGAHDMILRLPNGYSTRIGEGGTSLSAGQRQRVGLARAIFGSPFLVVLDEPNANLDVEGEKALTKAIEILRAKRCIIVVVSHRPSALGALNMAMIVYDGKMFAFGPRDEVFANLSRSNNTGSAPADGHQSLQRAAAGGRA